MDNQTDQITPEYVKSLTNFTDKFFCEIKDNIYKIRFLKFSVRDMDSGYILFEVADEEALENPHNISYDSDDTTRTMKYHLGPEFLELKNIGTALTFSVGDKPVKNLLMIERHYFKNKLIKCFEFKFDFCIPITVNNWETIYNIPDIDDETKTDMIENPWETKSDSFYFVDNKLIMHHKAEYNYSPLD
jgi:hypothetical protein